MQDIYFLDFLDFHYYLPHILRALLYEALYAPAGKRIQNLQDKGMVLGKKIKDHEILYTLTEVYL